jgi:hypothetical protein
MGLILTLSTSVVSALKMVNTLAYLLITFWAFPGIKKEKNNNDETVRY